MEFNDNNEYCFVRGEPIDVLELEIGSNRIPKFSCVAHKNNVAVTMSIKKHYQIISLLTAAMS